jgi:hypothetical protein
MTRFMARTWAFPSADCRGNRRRRPGKASRQDWTHKSRASAAVAPTPDSRLPTPDSRFPIPDNQQPTTNNRLLTPPSTHARARPGRGGCG